MRDSSLPLFLLSAPRPGMLGGSWFPVCLGRRLPAVPSVAGSLCSSQRQPCVAELVELPPPDPGGSGAAACAPCWVQEMGRAAADAFSLGNTIQHHQLPEKGRGFA